VKTRPSAQQGAALLTAMIIVTLVAALAAAMTWRQTRAVQVEAAERARVQSAWMLQGALDWARLILREDAIADQNSGGKRFWDHLGEPWAVPLAEARLSTFLAAQDPNGSGDASDGPEAFLSGRIEDAQARYNLRNLMNDTATTHDEQLTLERLCASAGVPQGTASLIASRLRAALITPPGDEPPLAPVNVTQLSWFGLPPEVIAKLEPLLTILPNATPVNLNTASSTVIAGVLNVNLSEAEILVRSRASAPLANTQAAQLFLPLNTPLPAARVSVHSDYFYVTGRLRLDEHVLQQRSLLNRNVFIIRVLTRERVSESAQTAP
jgi:general secretion pathway protein K